jgi:hypothetical protein
MTRVRRLLPWLMAAIAAAILLTLLLIPQQPGEGFATDLGPVLGMLPLMIAVSYAFVAGLILRRHPRHAVGWLLAWFAAAFSVGVVFDEYAYTPGLPAREWVAVFSGIGWIMGILPLVCLTPLLFPAGRVVSPGWRWFGGATVVGVVVVLVANVVDPALHADLGLANPLGIDAMRPWIDLLAGSGVALVVVGALGGFASIVRRYRGSGGVERAQITWFGYGASVTFVSAVALSVLYEAGRLEVGLIVFAVGSLALPTSIGVAILRYRLYDIDRIVSRTVSYAVVTLVLGGIYVAGVLGAGRFVLRLAGGGSELVVAASTLAVAAAFRPVRTRVQTAVDRRFNRSRYDATRLVETFAHRLRDEVDVDRLAADIRAVAVRAVQPAHATIWLGDRDGRPA